MPTCPGCARDLPADSAFCPRCGAAVTGQASSETGPYRPPEPKPAATPAPSGSGPDGRFAPGTVLAARYRIVALLGRGGMGEVYRADDLKLGQPVALKFLPEGLAADPQRLVYFHNEVRLARQVAHPNVCRVYDIGEADGQPFLSMEFVDGEDLASLLRRIGRLPEDKGVEIGRQLCAGLAAAHDRGVLHRDLKPANVMLDGRGRVRITDFGLAAVADACAGDVRAGTPAYMAPEQLAGREVTVQSDLYALGLVLYELFTGKRPFPARRREEDTPPSLSDLITGIDPAVERVILRCLEHEPRDRPASALAVLAGLSGGDPLGAALAAGETPSPEMVAAAGGQGGVRPAVALAWLSGLLAALALFVFLAGKTSLLSRVKLDEPAVFVHQAEAVLHELGHFDPQHPPADRAFGYGFEPTLLSYGAAPEAAVQFWYRSSPEPLVPMYKFQRAVTALDPPVMTPGMVRLWLDAHGQLLSLLAVPPRTETENAAPGAGVRADEWGPRLAKLMGFDDPACLTPCPPEQNPPVFADQRLAWAVRDAERQASGADRIEAAFLRGRLVSLRQLRRSADARPSAPFTYGFGSIQLDILLNALFMVVNVTAVVLTWRNLRAGRGDRRGAFRIALTVLGCHMIYWSLAATHVAAGTERWLFQSEMGAVLFLCGIYWLIYVAAEPYVRRLAPQVLISWSRLLAGRWRDPLVGHHVLVGLTGATVSLVLVRLAYAAGIALGVTPPSAPMPAALLGTRELAATLPMNLARGIDYSLWMLALFLAVRLVCRRQRAAVVVCFLVWAVIFRYILALSGVVGWPLGAVLSAVAMFLLFRYGILAVVVWFATLHLHYLPLTTDLSAWYAGEGLAVVGLFAALAVFACYTALGGQTLFRDEALRPAER